MNSGKSLLKMSLLAYQAAQEPLPQVGDFSIVTDWDGVPRCVIETTSVSITPFNEMTYEICKLEGEDATLASRQYGHRKFFTNEGRTVGYEFTELVGIDCTTRQQNDGKITGVNETMEYKLSDDTVWTSVTGNTITGLINSSYDIRVKANGTECSVCGYKRAAVEIPATGTPAKPDKPSKPNKPTGTSPSGKTSDTTSPKTGDSSSVVLWITILLVSGAVLTVALLYKRKKKYSR